jgi:hypothetical protein
MDLAATFFEIGNTLIPAVMTGKSLEPVFSSTENGQIDNKRAS